jgi:hypothetical protein
MSFSTHAGTLATAYGRFISLRTTPRYLANPVNLNGIEAVEDDEFPC